MSTKSSIAYEDSDGYKLHAYHECFDEQAIKPVYVHEWVHGERKNVSTDITLPPIAVVQIGLAAIADLAHTMQSINESDDEIRRRVESDVAKRIKYRDAKPGTAGAWMAFCGSAAYGSADDPEEQQIKSGIEHITNFREQCRTELAEIRGKLEPRQIELLDRIVSAIAGATP